MLLIWVEFGVCAALITAAGTALARYGDVIAQRTGVSRTWIGLVLLAAATSLPELVTGISSVTVADAPNIAVGDALGSTVFNLLILVVLDGMSREEPMYRRLDQNHILGAGFGIILIGLVGASLLLSRDGVMFPILHVAASTPLIAVLYLVAMRATFVHERRRVAQSSAMASEPGVTLTAALVRYATAAAVIAAAGTWLPFIGLDLADAMGWRTTFVGSLFIAAATSLPELVVTVGAFRLGLLDLAIGNLLGSNLFDVFIIAIDDTFYSKGPLLAEASPAHAVTAFAAVIMSSIVIVALVYRPVVRLYGTISWASLALLIVYLLSSYIIYLSGY